MSAQKRNPRNVLNSGEGWSPVCFENHGQYTDWIHLMRQSARPRDDGYCIDCTPDFKSEMLAQGRCAHPETRFVIYKNEIENEIEYIGVSNESRFWPKVQRGMTVFNWGKDDEEDQQ